MNKDKIIFISGIAFSLIVIVASGWLYYNSQQSTVNSQQLTAVTTKEPEATRKPQEEVNYKNSEIQVLNGTGKTGVAKTYADKLIKLGYIKVTTGNYEEIITGNLLFAPTDFGNDINLGDYTYKKGETIKIIIGK